MTPKLLDMQIYISLALNQTTRCYIEELHGVSCHVPTYTYDITLPEHAPTLIRTSLYSHVHRPGTPLPTVSTLGPHSLPFHFSALASSAPMLVRVGELCMSLLQSLG